MGYLLTLCNTTLLLLLPAGSLADEADDLGAQSVLRCGQWLKHEDPGSWPELFIYSEVDDRLDTVVGKNMERRRAESWRIMWPHSRSIEGQTFLESCAEYKREELKGAFAVFK